MPIRKSSTRIKVVDGMKVKYKDIFDMKAFYEALYEWFKEYGWKDEDDKNEHWETYYGERIDSKGAKELWLQWRAFKAPDHAPHLKYYLDLDFHCIALTTVEVVKEGMKMAVNKGEVEITTNSYIDKIYEQEFDKSNFLKWIKELFTDRVYRKQLEERKKELYQETYALQNYIKQWFKLKRYLPYEETKSFMPSYAWPSHLKE